MHWNLVMSTKTQNRLLKSHPSIVPWVQHPLVSNAHLTVFSTHLCLVSSFSECMFPHYTIPLHHPAILFLVFLFLISLPSLRTRPPLPVCYLPFYVPTHNIKDELLTDE